MRLCERIEGLIGLRGPIIDIQNVHEYVVAREDPSGEDHNWNLSDFPCYASPWPIAYYEWRDCRDDCCDFNMCVIVQTKRTALGFTTVAEICSANDRRFSVLGGTTILMNEEGSLETDVFPSYISKEAEEAGFDGDHVFFSMVPVWMATSFMSCKNVIIRDIKPYVTRQQRRHGPPAITYKVLDIGPITRVLREEGGVAHNGLKRALHICRGHFAHYSPDKPLFGKHAGTFWHPMHLRGDAKRGVVAKDYNVLPHDAA